ncbi:hypothetical protein ACFWY6_33620 [Streptomyces sp. NPDC059037]|uniref:hypothetical protein n=1 Tax=Streptomyces sp. NPDC059037 TaxID=3346710 RepID=UPI00368359FA
MARRNGASLSMGSSSQLSPSLLKAYSPSSHLAGADLVPIAASPARRTVVVTLPSCR